MDELEARKRMEQYCEENPANNGMFFLRLSLSYLYAVAQKKDQEVEADLGPYVCVVWNSFTTQNITIPALLLKRFPLSEILSDHCLIFKIFIAPDGVSYNNITESSLKEAKPLPSWYPKSYISVSKAIFDFSEIEESITHIVETPPDLEILEHPSNTTLGYVPFQEGLLYSQIREAILENNIFPKGTQFQFLSMQVNPPAPMSQFQEKKTKAKSPVYIQKK
jgi:hypothetical protein